ncbi:MAG: indolepyruvate ferredoxin oxidoreductase family protein [Rhodobacteraceae bacterium]|nr:indolepyruvate ferredoxin oxidoreductase family protein [Paracoccaceae bacterium]
MNISVSLNDKYTLERGRVYITGIQALVRLPLMQRQRDLAAGLNTAGYVSGYRGSPVATYDLELGRAQKVLEDNQIKFETGINEDLAATALWGTQQGALSPKAKYDGVFGIWYGKNPGLDRCGDAFKHANHAGTSANGGVLVVAGDDHGALSSSLANQSDQALIASYIPILYPANLQDYLDFGLMGFAMSRFSGLWVGFKAVTEVVESAASIVVDPDRVNIVVPDDVDMPPGGLNIRSDVTRFEMEEILINHRLPAALAFARANRIDRVVIEPTRPRIGIAAAGKAYLDLRQALEYLGIDDKTAAQLGIRVYKVGMIWPLEPEGARAFAEGLEKIIVIEEKHGLIEDQLTALLYRQPVGQQPIVVGKRDQQGNRMVPAHGEVNPTMIARILAGQFADLPGLPDLDACLAGIEARETAPNAEHTDLTRIPFFCSGCPHNSGLRAPKGSRVFGGVGCHAMAVWVPGSGVEFFTQMGGEGCTWIGEAPFSEIDHVFQNLGDGTFHHSGSLAIRATVAAKVNITFKILFNDAVAMTGGQTLGEGLTVQSIAHMCHFEGASRIVIASDEPEKYGGTAGFPPGVTIHHRSELIAVQDELRETPGTTILIYDQTCAAEKRRRRKRGTFPDPAKRAFINDLVCEGCGDCGVVSSCVAISPLETETGRKRVIDQSACNKDYSCVNGFCPAFVTVHGGGLRKQESAAANSDSLFERLVDPEIPALDAPVDIVACGIGGTGVLTVGALVGMAAHIEGKGVSVLDFTGLSQKNGEVMSEVRLAPNPEDLKSIRIATGNADVLLGCDLVVAAGAGVQKRLRFGKTRAVVNTHLIPTAGFTAQPDMEMDAKRMRKMIANALGPENATFLNATAITSALMGNSVTANTFVLGMAWQLGLIPLGRTAMEQAITLNGVAVADNHRAFKWGRLAVQDQKAVEDAAAPSLAGRALAETPPEGFETLVTNRVAELTAYQNAGYSRRYEAFVRRVADAENAQTPGQTAMAEAVARYLYKLMAYKDEYEVARLFTDGRFQERLASQFSDIDHLRFHLAPPLISRSDPETGNLIKGDYGPWVLKALKVLRPLRRLRGTAFDPFGYTKERRQERLQISQYEQVITGLIDNLSPDRHTLAVEIAKIPEGIRGYGHIKARHLEQAQEKEAILLAQFYGTSGTLQAAE